MNEFLANLYRTNGAGEDVQEAMIEKMASIEVLSSIAAQAGKDLSDVDWDQLSTDDIHGLIKEASEEGSEEYLSDEEQEKLAELDFAGRAMAHAFNNELGDIEKTAKKAGMFRKGLDYLTGKTGRYGRAGGNLREAFGNPHLKHPELSPAQMRQVAKKRARMGGADAKEMKGKVGPTMGGRFRAAGRAAKDLLPEIGAGAALTGGGAYALSKKSSAIDEIAAQRAQAFLNEKLASYEEDPVEAAIQARAAEMLYEAGYGDLLD